MKKKLLLLSLTLICVSIFANGNQEKNGVVKRKKIEVAVNSTDIGQVETYRIIFENIVNRYNSENGTDYLLNFQSGQSKDIVNTRMISNDKPDIFMLDSPADASQYAKDNLLLDLTQYAEKDGWEDRMFNWAYDLSKVDGKNVTLPYGYEGIVLWYNKEIMAELGLNPEDIDTLEEYENALKLAQEAGYIPVMLGSQDWPWAQEWYLSVMYSYTDRNSVKSNIEGNGSWNSEEFKKTVDIYKSWHDKKYLADGKSFVLTSDDAINAFSNGKALFKLEGTWAPYWITPMDQVEQDKIGVMLHPSINNTENHTCHWQ